LITWQTVIFNLSIQGPQLLHPPPLKRHLPKPPTLMPLVLRRLVTYP